LWPFRKWAGCTTDTPGRPEPLGRLASGRPSPESCSPPANPRQYYEGNDVNHAVGSRRAAGARAPRSNNGSRKPQVPWMRFSGATASNTVSRRARIASTTSSSISVNARRFIFTDITHLLPVNNRFYRTGHSGQSEDGLSGPCSIAPILFLSSRRWGGTALSRNQIPKGPVTNGQQPASSGWDEPWRVKQTGSRLLESRLVLQR
jgi:hypothetical protein